MEDKALELKKLLLETVQFFFPENGFGDESLAEVIASYIYPSERALEFIEHFGQAGRGELRLDFEVPEDSFYMAHRAEITRIDDLVYANFMDRKSKEMLLASSSIGFRGTGGNMHAKSVEEDVQLDKDTLETCQLRVFNVNVSQKSPNPVFLRPVLTKRPMLTQDITEFISEYGTCLNTDSEPTKMELGAKQVNAVVLIRETLLGLRDACDDKKTLQAVLSAAGRCYLSDEDLASICDHVFDIMGSNTDLMLQIYFKFLEKMDKPVIPSTFPSILNLVETYLFNSTNLHFIFKVFRKINAQRITDILELVLKKVYEIDIEIKLVAFDILLKKKNRTALFEDLLSCYEHLDSRKVDGMEFSHFIIIKGFSSCIALTNDSGRKNSNGCIESVSDTGVDKAKERVGYVSKSVFSEENYIRCTNIIFDIPDNTVLKEIALSCLKKLKTCGLSRTFVICFAVFNINKYRATKKYPHSFLLTVFSKFLDLSPTFSEGIFETLDEELVYKGILKLNNTRDSLVYVSRAIFMFLLKTLKRCKGGSKGRTGQKRRRLISRETPSQGNFPDHPGKSKSKCGRDASSKTSYTIGKMIKTLTKVEIRYINLTEKEKTATIQILKTHFSYQSSFIKEIIIAFLDKMNYQNVFFLLLELSKDASLSIRKKVFERLLKFRNDKEKVFDVVRVYFSLLKEDSIHNVSFGTQSLAEVFYFEEEKHIARHFHLSDIEVDSIQKAVLVKHYSLYKPEDVCLETVVRVLEDIEMVKIKKNSEYVNTILKIVLHVLTKRKERPGRSYIERSVRKKIEHFCNSFIFYDVYVVQCGKILKSLKYTALNGSGDYYTLINASLGRDVEIRVDSLYGKKALLAYLDYHPERSFDWKACLLDFLKCKEVQPELLKLLLKNLNPLERKERRASNEPNLGVSRKSTVAEFYFNFISLNQLTLFDIADSAASPKIQMLVYKLLMESTCAGAILPQLSIPYILKIMYRCRSLCVDKVVAMYPKYVVSTFSETLSAIFEAAQNLKCENDEIQNERKSSHESSCSNDLQVPIQHDRDERPIITDIFSSFRNEKDRLLFVEKLGMLLDARNALYITRSLISISLNNKELKMFNFYLKDAIQSVDMRETSNETNLKNVLVVFALGHYRLMLKTRTSIDISRVECLLSKASYTQEEKLFIQGLKNSIQLFE